MKTMTDMWRASRQCGYNEADRTAIKRLRRAMSVALVMFLGMNTLMSMHYGGVLGAAIATLTGVGFAAILVIAGMMATRAGDEFRRALLMQSLLWGMGITMVLTCVGGYVEAFAGLRWHIPLLAVPVCLVVTTALAKLIVFRNKMQSSAEPPPLATT